MDFGAILSRLFVIAIIAIIYYIILKALVLMGKDLKKTGAEPKEPLMTIEVIDPGQNRNLRRGAVIPVRDGVTFGRQNDNTVVLNDPYVSSYHVRFFRNEGRYVLEDLNSTNGTLLNGEKLKVKTYLKDGDIVDIGSLSMKIHP
jgi:pSer/pThr/pTyr-binding forkhead associated (FHA) protein